MGSMSPDDMTLIAEGTRAGDRLVETSGLYAAFFDEGSPVNRPGFMDAMLTAGKESAQRMGHESWRSLHHFNDRLMRAARRGELLAWTLLFDGVFRAVATLGSEAGRSSTTSIDKLGSDAEAADLVCPTGRLVLTSLDRLGMATTPMLTVAPGRYRVVLTRDAAQEFDHTLLEGVASYPAGEGPDWHLMIQRISAL